MRNQTLVPKKAVRNPKVINNNTQLRLNLVNNLCLNINCLEVNKADETENCSICLEPIDLGGLLSTKKLQCKHQFHKNCIDCWIQQKGNSCPLCKSQFGALKGHKLPGATMDINTCYWFNCPGFKDAEGTIKIHYSIPSGIQEV